MKKIMSKNLLFRFQFLKKFNDIPLIDRYAFYSGMPEKLWLMRGSGLGFGKTKMYFFRTYIGFEK